MPTHVELPRFLRDYGGLSLDQRRRFRAATRDFHADLVNRRFRPGLRVKRVATPDPTERVWELTWAPDGRATFSYGPEVIPGQAHIVWRRIGMHDIFRQP